MAFYEAWCPRCRVTHPPERKVCIHCGGRVQESREAKVGFGAGGVLETRLRLPGSGGEAPAPAGEAEASETPPPRAARLGMTLIWVALAIVATVLRMCQDRG